MMQQFHSSYVTKRNESRDFEEIFTPHMFIVALFTIAKGRKGTQVSMNE